MTRTPAEAGSRVAARFGRTRGVLLLAGTGVAATLVTGLVLGVLARAVEGGVDRHVDTWLREHTDIGAVDRQMLKLGTFADVAMTQVLALIATVVLAYAYRRRAWIPVLVIGGSYLFERVAQELIAGWVDRGHPAGTTGTFPSGGVLRVLTVHGAVVACTLALLPLADRAAQRVVWAGLLVLALGVALSRLWLERHWLSDVVLAFPLGAGMLAVEVAVVAALTAPVPRRPG